MAERWITAIFLAVVIGLPGVLIMSSQPTSMKTVVAQHREFEVWAIDGRRIDHGFMIRLRPDAIELHGPCGALVAPMQFGPLRQQVSFEVLESRVRPCGNHTFSVILETLPSVSSYGFNGMEPDPGIELHGDHELLLLE